MRRVERELNNFKVNRMQAHENLETRLTEMAKHFDKLLDETNDKFDKLDSTLTTSNKATLEKVDELD